MAKDQMYSRGTQIWVLLFGVFIMYAGASAAWKSYTLGHFAFTVRNVTATGTLAAFEICTCLVIGSYLIGSAALHLEDC